MLVCLGLFARSVADEPYPKSPIIERLQFDWTTHRRAAQGSDNFQLTWAQDGHLYGAWGDGGGFGGSNSEGRVGLGVARIEGTAREFRGTNIWGGADAQNPAQFDGKSWGMIGVGDQLHMWVVPDKPPGKDYRNHYEFIRLASSRDFGATWNKAGWKFTSFDGLTIPTFLNFGRANWGVPESFGDYVYSYFIRPSDPKIQQQGNDAAGLIVHHPGTIYLARVATEQLQSGPDRDRFEFFAGLSPNDQPKWGSIDEKRPVFRDSNGVGWCMSACYHPGFQRVLICTEHGESKAGLLGLFDAPAPWGPWTTVEYYRPGRPFGAQRPGSEWPWENNVFFFAFPTKWFDGLDFTANFTGAGMGKDNDSFNTVSGRFVRKIRR
ncbi:DUF4185 domain-containing protein [Crateriforma conspicua]|uniref:DUF4185 domain-containing protein n=1 Tax=Crateriforma conspicua TaxID=2527996 RepID=A0A5C5YAD1_9PLAN|nr:DUF4185 domain-containing protein [Crateriforma conspicua]TWT71411.1 hypothetical protein Pan14r_37210 [Crateriforma conspicua]